MSNWLKIIVAGLAIFALAACGSVRHIRHKMTIEVETPQGLKTGSAVRESIYRDPSWFPFFLGEDRGQQTVKGQAVIVDLPHGQTLFALLSSTTGDPSYTARIPHYVLGFGERDQRIYTPVTIWPSARKNKFPMLVTFGDLADPTSVMQVDPDNFAAQFGPGVMLKSITIELTNESVTKGIEKRLGWLEIVGRERATLIPNPPRLLKDSLPIQLVAPSDFSTELYK